MNEIFITCERLAVSVEVREFLLTKKLKGKYKNVDDILRELLGLRRVSDE